MFCVFFVRRQIMKMYVLLTAALIFGTVAPVLAAEQPAPGDLHGDIGYRWDSMYVWRGYLVYGHHSASHAFVDLDLFGTGFGLSVFSSWANASGTNPDQLGYNNEQRWDYTLFYAGALENDQPWETRYQVGYRYFNYPQMGQGSFRGFGGGNFGGIDLQEVFAGFALPKIFGVPGLVPSYALVICWPSGEDTAVGARNFNHGTYAGLADVFALDYALPLENISAEIPKQNLNFHLETVYNNHVDPRPLGGYTSADWTHVMFGISTDFDLGNNFIFTPGVWHQITMEDDPLHGVSPDHSMTWATLEVKYKF